VSDGRAPRQDVTIAGDGTAAAASRLLPILLRRARRIALRPVTLLGAVLLTIVAILVIAPMVSLIHTTFTMQLVDVFRIPGAQLGDFTLHHWERVLRNQRIFLNPLANTLLIGSGTGVLALVVGASLAWLTTRTDVPLRGLIYVLAVMPYVLPSWALALPWLAFFQNRSVQRPAGFLEAVTGIQAPEWLVFGPIPIIIVMGIHYFPFVFLMVASALKTLDSQLEEAGELLGASRWAILRTITMPIVVPAILAALLLAFSRTVGTFGTPALLGNPANFTVLPVQIRSFMTMNQTPQAFILALMLIALSVLLLYLNDRVVGRRRSYATISGKGVKHRLVALGSLRWIAAAVAILLLGLFVLGPLLLLVWSSFMYSPGQYSLSNFTLHYWTGAPDPAIRAGEPGILNSPRVWSSAWNSLRIAFVGGAICALLGLMIGYVVVRSRGSWLANTLEKASFLPMLIPSIAFGAIYLSLFSVARGPLPALYGSLAIMILVVIGAQLPFTARTGISAMHQVAGELEEAGTVTGASWFRRFIDIMWPLAKSGFVAGFLIVFITTMRELSLFILLMSPRTEVLTTLTFAYAEIGAQQHSYALMSFLVAIIFAVLGLFKMYEYLDERASGRRGRGR
jgi:iron(III) transport system permease protein